jgi:hypothetical protein
MINESPHHSISKHPSPFSGEGAEQSEAGGGLAYDAISPTRRYAPPSPRKRGRDELISVR